MQGTTVTREAIDTATAQYDLDLCELNEILAELGEKPTTFAELERAGISLIDSPRAA